MDQTLMRWRAALLDRARGADWGNVAIWLLCFGLLAYLGLKGGGYDPLVYDQVGIAVWWVLLAAVLVGALPRCQPTPLALVALGLFAAFTVWTALSLGWTESTERTAADLARLAGFLGVFTLAILGFGPGSVRSIVGAVAAGAALVVAVGLLSRLHPAWFPDADQTAAFLSSGEERLSYPLNYWNGLAALIAIGSPLLLAVATCAKSMLLRAAAAAALPAFALAAFFTLSRAGIAAAIVAMAVFLIFTSDRLPKLLILFVTGVGGGILIIAAAQRDALQDGLLNATARQQGDEMLVIVIVVCTVVGLIQAGLTHALLREIRPSWTLVSRQQSTVAAIVAGLAVLIVAAAFDAPGQASEAWDEFKGADSPGKGSERLGSVAGESRYEFWTVAAEQNSADPLTGTGSGTFEFWWTRNSDGSGTVRDAHSLYMQTLGEVGFVGLLLLAAFLLTVLIGGARYALRAGGQERPQLAAALAGCVAFLFAAAFDWLWQIPVLPVAMLLLAAALVSAGARPGSDRNAALRLPLGLGFGAVALAAIVAIAIPLATTSLLRQSEADAREGDLPGALEAARSAQNVLPGAATPRLQQGLLLEQMGDLESAAEAARAATERESTNWRPWLVLSRIEARRGRAAAAVRGYREARSLNPLSALFEQ
jgi:O-antigen ligase